MKRFFTRRNAVMVVAVAALSVGIVSPALAERVNVGGGIWDYGTGSGKVWSHYHHNHRLHKTAVDNGSIHRSGCVGRGEWAKVEAPDRWLVADHSYWNYCD